MSGKGGGGGEDVLENLSERKKTLLEARFFRQPPSSLDGLSTGSRSTSNSPASFQKHQYQQGQASGGRMGRGSSPSSFLSPDSLGRQKSAEPTVLDMTDTNSRSQAGEEQGGGGNEQHFQHTSALQRAPVSIAAAATAAAAAVADAALGQQQQRKSQMALPPLPPSSNSKAREKDVATAAQLMLCSPGNASSNSCDQLPLAAAAVGHGQQVCDKGVYPSIQPMHVATPAIAASSCLSGSSTSVVAVAAAAAAAGAPPLPAGCLPKGSTASSTSTATALSAAAGGRKRPRTTSLSIEAPQNQHPSSTPAPYKSPTEEGIRPPSMSPSRMAGDGSGKSRTIASYFTPSSGNVGGGGGGGGNNSTSSSGGGSGGGGLQRTGSDATRGGGANISGNTCCSSGGSCVAVQEALRSQVHDLERQLQEAIGELGRVRREKEEQEAVSVGLREELIRVQDEGQRHKDKAAEKERRAAATLEEVIRKLIYYQERETRELLGKNSHRLGRIVTSRSGPHGMTEIWEDGTAHKELQKQSAELLQRKEDLDRRKRQIAKESRKALATLNSSSANNAAAGASSSSASPAGEMMVPGATAGGGGESSADGQPFDELQLMEAEEGVRMHLGQLKKDEATVQEARKALEKEKSMYVRELRRVQHEDRSRFSRRPVMNGRYLLLSLLGRGGFSEVWKAFDLREYCEAAVKIHQLNSSWTEEKKHNYMKHATREYAIHREMVHPRVVRLFDVFEIDSSSFATVLEYCKGTDLDFMMKTQKNIPERDARAITIQILSGLRYLNTPSGEGANRRQGIIHYDLKPGNILFDEQGDVKITDFGLSKIVDDSSDGHSLELTSQGAGTYWYLPPECFVMGSTPPRISSKVDVWALGVIFFQMMFGTRPFGEGQSQEKVLHENTMLRATHVNFPPKPLVSPDAKEFIKACLTHSQADRPDVLKLCGHPYLRLKKL